MANLASQAYCFACFNTSLSEINGVLVCDACGTQTEVHAEEEEENYDPQQRRGQRRILTQTEGPQTQDIFKLQYADKANEEALIQGVALTYMKCLQCMLQAQADTLVQRFEMNPDMASLIRHLWLSYIPRTRILDMQLDEMMVTQEDIRRQQKQQRQQSQAAAGGAEQEQEAEAAATPAPEGTAEEAEAAAAEEEDDDAAGDGNGQKRGSQLLFGQATKPQRIYKAFKRVLPPHTSLLVCYLACLVLRQPVTPLDLCRWALQGHLPYLDMPTRCQALLQSVPLSWRPPMQLLSPAGCPEPLALMEEVQKLADALQLPLPNVNGELLLLKCCKELHVPDGIFLVARELYLMYFMDSHLMNLSSHTGSAGVVSSSPYVSVVALVCMAMKLGYGIGRHPDLGSRLPGLPDAPSSWVDWAEACMLSPACKPLHLPSSTDQAQSLRGTALLEYLAFCQEHVFAGGSCPEALQGVQRVMQSVLKRQQGGEGQGQPQDTAGDALPLQQGSAVAPVQRPSEAAARQLTPIACKPIYTYAKFSHSSASTPVPADIAVLLAVAAAYADTRLSSVMLTLTALESTMATVEVAYKQKREELQVALGAPLLRHAEGKDADRLKVGVADKAAAPGYQPGVKGTKKQKVQGAG